MYGINGGYDTRQIATGDTTNDLPIIDPQTVFFQQVAINAEVKSNQWGFSAYGLIPVGEYGYGSDNVARINFFYGASPLTTVGADISCNILPELSVSGGYYYQYSEKETDKYESYPDGSGFKARLAYNLSDQLQAGVVYTYDENFEWRVSAELKVRFGSGAKPKSTPVVITALNETPSNRNVRTANSEYITVVLAPGSTIQTNALGTAVQMIDGANNRLINRGRVSARGPSSAAPAPVIK